jgi:transcription elongation GreA/GreB family factor
MMPMATADPAVHAEGMTPPHSFQTATANDETVRPLNIHEEQTVMDARIARLEDLLATATVIRDDQAGDVATLGSMVEVEYRRTRRRATYRLTGAASRCDGRGVSARSPVGRALMGRRAGEIVSAELPGGRAEQLFVVAITAALAEAS